jgi:2-hydroxy-6-oxonona-2,4-dienedioate hydrolase
VKRPEIVDELDSRARRVTTSVPGGAMVWRTWEQGPPLLLLHGASGSWTHWIRNIAPLAERFSVIVPDMPGFGDSAPPPEPHTVEVLAEAVTAGLDAVTTGPLDVAGFSFGSIVAGHVAARLGARVRSLVLFGAGGLGLPRAPTPPLRPVTPTMPADDIERAHRANLAILMIADPMRIDALAVALQNDNVRRARFRSGDIPTSDALVRVLPSVRARVTAIYSSRDSFIGGDVETRRRVLTTLRPDVEVRVLDGAGHWAIYEAAEPANAMLLDALRAKR